MCFSNGWPWAAVCMQNHCHWMELQRKLITIFRMCNVINCYVRLALIARAPSSEAATAATNLQCILLCRNFSSRAAREKIGLAIAQKTNKTMHEGSGNGGSTTIFVIAQRNARTLVEWVYAKWQSRYISALHEFDILALARNYNSMEIET